MKFIIGRFHRPREPRQPALARHVTQDAKLLQIALSRQILSTALRKNTRSIPSLTTETRLRNYRMAMERRYTVVARDWIFKTLGLRKRDLARCRGLLWISSGAFLGALMAYSPTGINSQQSVGSNTGHNKTVFIASVAIILQ